MPETTEKFIPTRESLLSRIKNWDDQESWREFFQIYRGLIFSTARKAGLTEAEAEDVVQETLISIAKTIKGFDYDPKRCLFKTWLRHLTRKRIADCYRKRAREASLSASDPTSSSSTASPAELVPDLPGCALDEVWESEWKQQLLEAAVERLKKQIKPEQFQIFDLYVRREMPVKKVADLLGINVAQVYLAKHRASLLLKKEIKRLRTEMS
ncbi:MAG: RNA polymerase sigma factor [Limisphaerales bacterium]